MAWWINFNYPDKRPEILFLPALHIFLVTTFLQLQGLIPEAFIPMICGRLMLLMSLLLDIWELFMFLWIHIRAWFMLLLILKKHLLVISRFLQAFSYMGLPKHVKTDNGPAYVSHGFAKFLSDWNISHSTGIPYNSQDHSLWSWTHSSYSEKYVF